MEKSDLGHSTLCTTVLFKAYACVFRLFVQVIAKPMALNIVQRKLRNNDYSDENAWLADIQLIVDNCLRFNQGTRVVVIILGTSALPWSFSRTVRLCVTSLPRAVGRLLPAVCCDLI